MNPTTGYAEVEQNIPIQRLRSAGKSQVLEILKVEWGTGSGEVASLAATNQTMAAYLTTRSFGTTEPTSVQQTGVIIDKFKVTNATLGTATAGSQMIWDTEVRHDISDGVGHGILVATDSVIVGFVATSNATPLVGNLTCRMLYRWKNVSLAEYIGIVQSQQA